MNLSIYETYQDLLNSPNTSIKSTKLKLSRLFQVVLDEALIQEKIHFTSLFSKIAFLGVRYQLPSPFMYQLHFLRKRMEIPLQENEINDVQILSFIIPTLYAFVNQSEIPSEILSIMPTSAEIPNRGLEIQEFIPHVKFYCIEIDTVQEFLIGYIDEGADELIYVSYNISDRNERFTDNLENLQTSLPVLIELIEVEVNLDGIYRPAGFVVEPDFLMDVTSIANCFDHNGTKTVGYLYKKFLPTEWSKSLIMGNVANFFLDRIIGEKDVHFEDVLKEVFQLDPLGFASVKNDEMSKLVQDMKKHFFNIKKSILQEFPRENINPDKSYLEPSFISAQYGIQGRLDLLHMDEQFTSIIELKSGSIFKPNVYGLKNDHYVQTLLYDLLIRSAFNGRKPRNYILYSKESDQTLRIAPRIAAQQKEAMKVRNDLLALEQALCHADKVGILLRSINSNYYREVKGFESKNIAHFERVYGGLDEVEIQYFHSFVNFIALEHKLAKIGEYGQDKSNGLAGLWLDSTEEKTEQFNMITHLLMDDNKSSEITPLITLKHSEFTNTLSNFRQGDIIVLYPLGNNLSVLKNQVFKCTLLSLDNEKIVVRLKSQQKNQEIFENNLYWAIEHDVMDSSFYNMYRQLFEWAGAPKEKRDLLMTRKAPAMPEIMDETHLKNNTYEDLTDEQNAMLHQMIHAKDYYLVWGPPGTGKTSKIISHYIKHIIENTDENLYVLAYTNRAVDELCECIEALGQKHADLYLRIGSRFGTDDRYVHKLLNTKIEHLTTRAELKKEIKKHRIVVGTLASIYSKDIIFSLLPAKKIIIDEASQILEPNIIGLLSRFETFIMVGDHRQLPAVVVQQTAFTEVEEESLLSIGLVDRRDSLFERLYRKCIENNWGYAWGQLKFQGRMHRRIMNFPNAHFYDGQLHVMPGLEDLEHDIIKGSKSDVLGNERMIFQHVQVPLEEKFSKTNSAEVKAVVKAVETFHSQGYSLEDIGIITPFRAQIAAINDGLLNANSDFSKVSVDTVERYQGGARRVIIISFCCNSSIQFRSIVSISTEGIDRKLNVALTRAREKLLIIGDQYILRRNPLYDQLIDDCVNFYTNIE